MLDNVKGDLLSECEFPHKERIVEAPTIEVGLYGYYFPALLDTGSVISALSEQVFGQLERFHAVIPSFSCTGVRVAGAFKAKLKKIKRQMALRFTIGRVEFVFEFLLIPDLACDIILGTDWLRTVRAQIDLGNHLILIKPDNEWLEGNEINPVHECLQEPLDIRTISVKQVCVLKQAGGNEHFYLSKFIESIDVDRSYKDKFGHCW